MRVFQNQATQDYCLTLEEFMENFYGENEIERDGIKYIKNCFNYRGKFWAIEKLEKDITKDEARHRYRNYHSNPNDICIVKDTSKIRKSYWILEVIRVEIDTQYFI